MDKKLSGLVRPTPLISYTKTENLNKRPGLKPPTTVSHFFEKPLNDKLDYSEPQLPLNIHPQKTVQSTPAVVLDKYADGLSNWNDSPIKVKLCNPEVFQESKPCPNRKKSSQMVHRTAK
ncbi:hypothetical protein MXB_3350 [Myxobolus squamalis]|nr:hypothetical protein MXB_3350 [Myxobolus squamalis]